MDGFPDECKYEMFPHWGLSIATQFEITEKNVGILRHNGKFEYES